MLFEIITVFNTKKTSSTVIVLIYKKWNPAFRALLEFVEERLYSTDLCIQNREQVQECSHNGNALRGRAGAKGGFESAKMKPNARLSKHTTILQILGKSKLLN